MKYDYKFKTFPKTFKELRKEIKNGVGLIWNDPDPIEDNDYKITSIEKIPKGLDKEVDPTDYPISIVYNNGKSNADVLLSEIYYEIVEVEPEFTAIYNPFLRLLIVKYGNHICDYVFKSTEEWTSFYYNGDFKTCKYLHVQLDYDENAQLLFYPRADFDDDLHEELGCYYNSEFTDTNSTNIILVNNDTQTLAELKKMTKPEDITYFKHCEY